MITTHLALFSFIDGASTVVATNPGNFGGYHPVGPYALLTGFTELDATTPGNFSGYHTVGPYALLTGFTESDTPVVIPEETTGGGWIDPKLLRKLLKEARDKRTRPYEDRRRRERERVTELTRLYEQITGTEVAEAAADIIRSAAHTEALIPEAAQIDMLAVLRNADMLASLEGLVARYIDEQEDEELLLLALVH